MGLSNLTWTHRAEVAAELLDYLQGTHPLAPRQGEGAPDPPRARVAGLLSLVATAIHRNPLLALALDPKEEPDVRRSAIWGLVRISAVVSGEDLRVLLNAEELWKGRLRNEDRGMLLSLARSASSETVAQEHLAALDRAERALLLATSSPADADAPRRMVEWLYQEWLARDRHDLPRKLVQKSLNRRVIRRTLARAESRRVLQELWRKASGPERGDLLHDLQDEDHEWTFPDPLTPAEHEELAQALVLPVPALLARFGRRGLIGVLEKTLTAEHHALASTEGDRRSVSPEAHRRLRVALFWQDPELDDWLAGHALGARLHLKLRRHLLWFLWRRNRSLAVAALSAALRAGDWKLALTFLEWMARDPRSGDRELLREAFRPELPEQCRYLALTGLDRLGGETGAAWHAQVEALSRNLECHPRLRLRALGALTRNGDAAALQELTAQANDHPQLLSRAEAISVLGEIAPAEAFPVLERALSLERRSPNQVNAPAAEEAAFALARLGTPAAITLLLRAYLYAETRALRHGLEDYVTGVMDFPAGQTSRIVPAELNWRSTFRWDSEDR